MKKGIIILRSLLVCATVAGQSKIYSFGQPPDRTWQWTINGFTFYPTADNRLKMNGLERSNGLIPQQKVKYVTN